MTPCRTPLNGIMGHLDLILSNGLSEDCREENLEGVQVALDSGTLLISIIQDILDLSKIEAGQMDIVRNPLSIREMMENTMKLANAYQIQRKKTQVRLHSEIVEEKAFPDRIYGDQIRLQQGMPAWFLFFGFVSFCLALFTYTHTDI